MERATRTGSATTRRASAVAVLAFGVLWVGVGIGPTLVAGSSVAHTTRLASSASTPTTAEAKADLLVIADFPAGWSKLKLTNPAAEADVDGRLAACLGVPAAVMEENPPTVDSPQFFSKGNDDYVNERITIFPSTEAASAKWAAISGPRAATCWGTLAPVLRHQLVGSGGKGVTVGQPTVTAVDPAVYGPGTAGYTASVTVTIGKSETLEVSRSDVYVFKGRLGTQVEFGAVGAPFPPSLAGQLVGVAAGRL